MLSRHKRQDTSIDDRKLRNAVEQQLVRDTSTILLGHHSARATRMRKRRRDSADSIHPVDNVIITGVLRARRGLDKLVLRDLRALPDGAEETHAGCHDGLVDGVAERVVQDPRGTLGVGGVNGDGAAGKGLLETDEDTGAARTDRELNDGGVLVGEEIGEDFALGLDTCDELLAASVDGGKVGFVLLGLDLLDEFLVVVRCDLRKGNHRQGVSAGLGERTGLVGLVLRPCRGVEGGVSGQRLGVRSTSERSVESDHGVWVILEVGADTIVSELDGDTGSLEHRLGSNTTELEEFGSVDGASSEDDFLLSVDSGGLSSGLVENRHTLGNELLATGEHKLLRFGAEQQLEVRPRGLHRVVVRVTSLRPFSSQRIHGVGVPRDTSLFTIVTIEEFLDTRTFVGRDERQNVRVLEVGNAKVERAVAVPA